MAWTFTLDEVELQPIGVKGRRRSEKRIAASTSMTSTGCIVTATASSGWRQISSSE
jgi:hypothetical protein